MEDLTFIIKTLLRPNALRRLVKSVRKHYPSSPVLVADDSDDDRRLQDVEGIPVIQLPIDTGLAQGRNILLSRVETPFLCNLDDDWELVNESNVRYLRSVLEQQNLDLVAGRLKWAAPPYWIVRYEGNFKKEGDALVLDATSLRGNTVAVDGFNVEYRSADLVHNFFVAKTASVKKVQWDPQFKIGGEHEDFFWRAKGVLSIAFCPQIWVNHHRDYNHDEYQRFRNRGTQGWLGFQAKFGFSCVRREPLEYWNYL